MSVGFRKSLLGFNCEDVMSYIENSHKAFSKKEKEFKEKIDDLDGVIKNVNAELESIKEAKAQVEAELKAYTDKKEEIERLSQNIGKLYLVAQSNAQAIMKNSDESRSLAEEEIARNLSSINEAHESLDALKERVLQTSNDFILTYMMCSFLDGKYFTISAFILIKYSCFLYVMSRESKTVC